jgi:hypothetical protein
MDIIGSSTEPVLCAMDTSDRKATLPLVLLSPLYLRYVVG